MISRQAGEILLTSHFLHDGDVGCQTAADVTKPANIFYRPDDVAPEAGLALRLCGD